MATENLFTDTKGQAGPAYAPTTAEHNAMEDGAISLLDLLIMLAERKRIILWITAVFAIAAIITSLLLPKSYTATVTLLTPRQGSSMGSMFASELGNLGGVAALASDGLGLKNPNDMFVAMLKSRTVEDAMVQRFNLMREYHKRYLSDARRDFESHASVDGSNMDGLIHISVEDHDPHRAAELANGYVDEFRTLSEHLAITEAAQRSSFFGQQLEQAKDNLANAEEAMKETEQKTGLIQPDSQARSLIESAAALRAEIGAKEVQIQAMQTYATGQNAQLIQTQQELDSLRAQLAKLGGSEDSPGEELMLPKGQVPEASLEYVRRLRDVKYYETIFDMLARQFEAAKLDEAKEGALIQVVDPAIPPDRRSFPKRGLIVIATTAIGFFIGVLIAFILAGFQYMKDDPESGIKLGLLRNSILG